MEGSSSPSCDFMSAKTMSNDDTATSLKVSSVEVSHEATSLVQNHFRSLTIALQDEFENLEMKKKDVDKEADALKKEKKQMQSVVSDEDIIYLNIGGDTMSCSRATLCQVEGSLLTSMFSGRWESGHKKDKHDNVFLDFNPICFKVVLNYLRAKRIETPERKAKKPSPPVNEEDNFWNLAVYLGLFEEFQTIKNENQPNKSGSSRRDESVSSHGNKNANKKEESQEIKQNGSICSSFEECQTMKQNTLQSPADKNNTCTGELSSRTYWGGDESRSGRRNRR